MNVPVTVIIPCYNYAHYLGEAIESALAQTYHPVEILVVNDGSTDNTVEVASQYPVIIHSHRNQGAAATFNRGIALSKGVFFVILSADDRLDPCFIEKTLPVLLKDPSCAFAYTHARMFGSRHGRMLSRDYDLESLKISNYIFGTALIRKDAFTKTPGFDPSLASLEDYDLWLAFAEKNYSGKLIPEPLFYYRQHAGSRNDFSPAVFRKTMLKIWWKHRTLYSIWGIARIVIAMQIQRISLSAIGIIVRIAPASLKHNLIRWAHIIRHKNGLVIEDD